MNSNTSDNKEDSGVSGGERTEVRTGGFVSWLTRLFDKTGSLFSKMVRGIFVFIFQRLPVGLWHAFINDKFGKLVWAFVTMMLWASMWIVLVFASWIIIDIEKFKKFWLSVWQFCWKYIDIDFGFVVSYLDDIWIGLALLGSVYGLLFVPAKFALRFWKKKRFDKTKNDCKQSESI